MIKIKITTDKNGFVHVYTASGEEIEGVTRAVITCDPRKDPRPTVELAIIDADIDVDANTEIATTITYRKLP